MSARAFPTLTGRNGHDASAFSLRHAILSVVETGRLPAEFQHESDVIAGALNRSPKGFFIPSQIVTGPASPALLQSLRQIESYKRGLVAGIDTAGGYTVGTDLQTGSLIELLRNKLLVAKMGARSLDNLSGNVQIPKVSGTATAHWLGEIEEVPQSQPSFGQLTLTPHRLSGDVAFSKELLVQSSIDVEALIRNDLAEVLAVAKDLAAIAGTGGVQPLGILNQSGLGTVTFGGAATFAKIVEFETTLSTANADVMGAKLAYLTTPAARGKLKTKLQDPTGVDYVWTKESMNGYPAYASLQVPSNLMIFGNWRDLILASWGAFDVVVDPYSLKRSGQVEITVTEWVDIGVRHPASFVVSTDTAAA